MCSSSFGNNRFIAMFIGGTAVVLSGLLVVSVVVMSFVLICLFLGNENLKGFA